LLVAISAHALSINAAVNKRMFDLFMVLRFEWQAHTEMRAMV
jgi:hypothetical protein